MIIALLLAISMATGPVQAQTAPTAQTAQGDSRWAPWLGCWQLVEDNVVAGGARVCVSPIQASGVTLETLVGVQRANQDRIIADGVSHAVRDEECQGTEQAEWSKNGQRVFRRAAVTCGKDAPRTVSGLLFMSPRRVWIDVQVVESAGARSVRVRRYRRAADQRLPDGATLPAPSARALATAPAAGSGAWNVDEVIEASAKLPPEALQAALIELNMGFSLNAKGLVAMDDAQVPDSVIDLMVALSFPKRFVVDRAGRESFGATAAIDMWSGNYDPFDTPLMVSPYCNSGFYGAYGYANCGYYSSSYSGFYGYSGFYPGGGYYPYYPGGGWIVVNPGPGQPSQPQPEGRVINGRGYTQVRPREPEPLPGVRTGRGDGGSTSSTAGSNSGSSNGSSSGASPQGYSGGASGGGDGARTAVPRPPGQRE